MKANEIIKEIESLEEEERMKVLRYLNEKYIEPKTILLGKGYDWWNNEEDGVYNEK